ncbi:SRPBCC family protein [Deinococcus peraridilitoris]|uniref:Putative integral membrane protein n=1 Tax=Deinococcus peraridilitoris (strain DSM 19664 / LMG 22246 / CIP 109416 / KR-200) TaxID=937777 RepID=L0A6F1_DEIPD|nr:SRPBCC family protein [Deinococcus peraridilitoris]AFZ69024.1 putative integral membrane protein [Deinococcus peraridilitoris DSM 19664]
MKGDESTVSKPARNEQPGELSIPLRVALAALGTGLMILGTRRPDNAGTALATSGALGLSVAALGRGPGALAAAPQVITVERATTIMLPAERIYAFWRDYTNLPQFMSHLESVTMQGQNRSHWVAKGPAGTQVEWDAETIEDVANERIAWRALEGASVPNEGHVTFREVTGGRGTEVRVTLRYESPAGALGAAVARLLGEEPTVQVNDDLRQLKRLLETGALPTTEGQSSGRKNPMTRTLAKAFDNRRTQ